MYDSLSVVGVMPFGSTCNLSLLVVTLYIGQLGSLDKLALSIT